MPNYKNGKIYKIVCNETNEVYYGCTTQNLTYRIHQHISDCKLYRENGKKKCNSYPIIHRNNFEVWLVEECPCKSRKELLEKEQFYILSNTCVNKVYYNHLPKPERPPPSPELLERLAKARAKGEENKKARAEAKMKA
jgi:hypothetical protein